MRLRKLLISRQVTIGAVLVLSLPSIARAAGTGAHHGPNWWYVINFLVFFIPFFLVLRKPFNTFWVKRSRMIGEAVRKGELELVAAQERLQVAQDQLASLDSVVSEIASVTEEQTENEVKEVITEAQAQVERIQQQAVLSGAAEVRSLERDIQNELAQRVIDTARQRLSDGSHTELDQERREVALQGARLLLQ